MNSLKKWVSIILVCMVMITAVACGSNVDTQQPQGSGVQQSGDSSSELGYKYQKLIDYPEPTSIGGQGSLDNLRYEKGTVPKIAFMPPGLELPYSMAFGQGIIDTAERMGAEVITLAPQSNLDINTQVGMINDAITQGVDAILINPHDDNACAPALKQAVEAGVFVLNLNSDSTDFPSPIHAVVGYRQRDGNRAQGQWLVEQMQGKEAIVGIIEGAPGYHTIERVEGFLEGIADQPNFKVVSSLSGNWTTDGGNTAAMDMLQAHPDINVLYCANDMSAMGAQKAVQALGLKDVMILANDGNTEFLEEIAEGRAVSTLNTQPYAMGETAMQVTADALEGIFKGGYVESPSMLANKDTVIEALRDVDKLFPKPSKQY